MRSHRLSRWLHTSLIAFVVILAGCGGMTTNAARPTALRVISAAVTVNPEAYQGACGANQRLTFSATIVANPNNLGGTVQYLWRIGYTSAQGSVTFNRGETSKVVTRALDLSIPPDALPDVRASIETSTPNAVASTEVKYPVNCTVPFTIIDVSATVQPWTAGCGPQAFGFAAVITAPPNNAGGQIHYTWAFRVGASVSGDLIFAPGQTTQTVTATQTYNIVHGASAQPAANSLIPTRTPFPVTPTPTVRDTPTPHPTPSVWPVIGPGDVYGVLYVNGPNSASDDAWPTIYC